MFKATPMIFPIKRFFCIFYSQLSLQTKRVRWIRQIHLPCLITKTVRQLRPSVITSPLVCSATNIFFIFLQYAVKLCLFVLGHFLTTVSGKMGVKDITVDIEGSSAMVMSAVLKPMVCSASGIVSSLYIVASAVALLR